MPFSAEGKRAVVFNLSEAGSSSHALKVFKKAYRTPSLLESAALVEQFQSLPGMLAAKRTVFGPSDQAVIECPDLLYSMLMPWIRGSTWFDILSKVEVGRNVYGLEVGLPLCRRFLEVMKQLELAGLAHTDIAPGNVMVDLKSMDVQLLDLEDLYVPGSNAPQVQNTGSAGYRHPSADSGKTTWCAEGDRYALAVMAAEMLLLANPALRAQVDDNGLFAGDRTSPSGGDRFAAALPYLQSVDAEFARLFEFAWWSPTLEDCPRASQFLEAIGKVPVPQPKVQVHVPGVVWEKPGTPQPPKPNRPLQPDNRTGGFWTTDPTPNPPTPPILPQNQATSQGLSAGQWFAIAVTFVVVIILVLVLVEKNRAAERQRTENMRIQAEADARRRQLEEEQRARDEAAAKLKREQEAAVASAEAYVPRFEQWLDDRERAMVPNVIKIRLRNECKNPIDLAMRFKLPDDSAKWATMGWWTVRPGDSTVLKMVTAHGTVYYYAEDTTGSWNGKNDADGISVEVVGNRFAHLDGTELQGRNKRTVSMFRRDYKTWGEQVLPLTCQATR